MSNSDDGDDAVSLPLRHWLIKQVESKKFFGLEWIEKNKYIKIPWIQQHYPDWQASYQLYVVRECCLRYNC